MSEVMSQRKPFLEVKDLVVEYFTKEQTVHAVMVFRFNWKRAEHWGW